MLTTWRARILRYLDTHDFLVDTTPPQSGKYLKYRKRTEALWYYVGPNGAVHISRQGTLKTAIPMTDMVHLEVRRWEQRTAGRKVTV